MSTTKHRIAAYLPPEVNEKFHAFKQERGLGDSQALIQILTEFLEVSQQVSYSNSLDIKALKSELLSELLSELEFRFCELKGELLSKPLKSMKINQKSLKEVKVSQESLDAVELDSEFVNRPTIVQLSTRFGCDSALIRKQKSKYKDEPDKFIAWSKSRDPDGWGWQFDEIDRVFDRCQQ
jgi:hypothetical protein